MAHDHIRYDLLTQEALRSVVRRVLSDAARNGLPGDHHFYISFDTRHDGVRISSRLHGQYPEEMTIVLQHQFWDLAVTEQALDVGLSFNGIPERLHVPFEAVKGFFDPSVQFGLQFQTITEPEAAAEPKPSTVETPSAEISAPATPPITKKAVENPDAPADEPDAGAQVVRLDRFRKK